MSNVLMIRLNIDDRQTLNRGLRVSRSNHLFVSFVRNDADVVMRSDARKRTARSPKFLFLTWLMRDERVAVRGRCCVVVMQHDNYVRL